MSIVRRYLSALAAVGLVALLLPIAAAPVAADSPATVPTGFRDQVVWAGLTGKPTVVSFAPDGKVFVAMKNGVIDVFDSLTDTSPTTLINLSTDVYNYWDRGLLGFTVDPGYPAKPYVYALYTYDHILGDSDAAPRWNDVCPAPANGGPGGNLDGCTASGRLERLTVSGNSVIARKTLIEDWCVQFPSHSVGALAFGPDGALYASGGDGASFNTGWEDHGQYGASQPAGGPYQTPVNPCGDPTNEGGGLRSQDVRTSGDPTGLDGSIIRIDPATGAAWPSNYRFDVGDANSQRIIAYGFRNPFRFTIRPAGDVWISDVGENTWEEIDKIASPDAVPKNFGWPCYEGSAVGSYYTTDPIPPLCSSLSAGAVTGPVFKYQHFQPITGDTCINGSSSISGLAFVPANNPYPASYHNGLFFTDYSRRCIWFAPAGAGGDPNFGAATLFADLRRSGDTDGGSVFLGMTPAGNLVYTDYDRNEVRQVTYQGAAAAPNASFTASPASGPVPLHVTFDARASSDANGDPLTYAWDLDGDGQYDDATGVSASRTYSVMGVVDVALKVSDPGGLFDTVTKAVNVGVSPPVVTWPTPPSSTTWAVGDQIPFAASATDAQDGALPDAAFTWTLIVDHCPSTCHQHIVETHTGVSSGTFDAPAHDYPSHLTIKLEVTDSVPLTTTLTRDLQPKTGTVDAVSSPPGIALKVNGTVGRKTAIVGNTVSVEAPATAVVGSAKYAFDQWSDGGDAAHQVTVTAGAKHLTASYDLTGYVDAPSSCSSAPANAPMNTFINGQLDSAHDVDFFRFTVSSTRYYRIVLGNLPAAASLMLYRNCSTLVAKSDRAGAASEEILRTLTPGTYALRVAAHGVADPGIYGMRIKPLSTGFTILSARTRVDASTLTIVGEVFNGSSSTKGPVKVTVRLLAADGTLLATRTGLTETSMPGHSRISFKIVGPVPAGFAKATYAATGPTYKTLGGVSFSGTSSRLDGGRWRVSGTATAVASLRSLRVSMTQYDTWGSVMDVTRATVVTRDLAKGQHTTYDAWSTFDSTTTPDTVRLRGYGYRT